MCSLDFGEIACNKYPVLLLLLLLHHQLNSRGYATIRRPRRIHWRFTYDETMQRSQKITFSVCALVDGTWQRPFQDDKLSCSR